MDGKTVIGTATTSKDGDVIVTIKNGLTPRKIYVSVTNYNANESEKVEMEVAEEAKTVLPGADVGEVEQD